MAIYMVAAFAICFVIMAVLVGTIQSGLRSFTRFFEGEDHRGWKLAGLSVALLAAFGAAVNFYHMILARRFQRRRDELDQ